MHGDFTSVRIPRAHVDPIDSTHTAQLLLGTVLSRPMRFETVVLLLDDQRRGVSMISVDGTTDPESVFVVADLIIESSRSTGVVGSVIIASVRPGGHDELDDLDRWAEVSTQLDEAGIELVEWYVVGRCVSCPRSLAGDPPRWIP